MEIVNVAASQIMPVSGYTAPPSIAQVKKEVENFFFSKGPLAYKIYKNAYTSSLGDSASPEAFIQEFFNALENSIKLQLRDVVVEPTTTLKNVFEILRNSFAILSTAGVKIDPVTFYATLVAFVLSKLK